ncbi:MAG: alkaline phosphatase family protein [Erysipelotrichaceae bacterium]|nr:alkaline phosphatase family protein [Erysipelotrichaceae bacterium]
MKKKTLKTILKLLAIVLIGVVGFLYVNYFVNLPLNKPDRISDGIVPSVAQVSSFEGYDRVVIFGCDGAGGYFSECETPNFDRIFSNINLNGTAEYPTMSGANWTSMFTGVLAKRHQVTNAKAMFFHYKGDKYPTFFKSYGESHEVTMYSVVNWSPINHGSIEENIPGMTKVNAEDYCAKDASSDEIDRKVTELLIERLNSYDDKIVFIQFDSIDHEGHEHGYGAKEYVEAMEKVDGYMGMIYEAYEKKGWAENTLFICVSDHGHTLKGGHGGESETEKLCTLALGDKKGLLKQGSSQTYISHDLASVVLFALKEVQPAWYDGMVPKDLFKALN